MHHKYAALFTSVNMLLALGPLILPMPFYNAGIILSIGWMVIITLLSYKSTMFMAEAMDKISQLGYINNWESAEQPERDDRDSLLTKQSHKTFQLHNPQITKQKSVQEQAHKQYDHSFLFEVLFGGRWKYFPCIPIIGFLTGSTISKCIITGNTLSKVFNDVDGPQLLTDFRFWMCVFFVCGALFSFRSIEKTKIMQTVIIGFRLLSILSFFFGAVYLIFTEGIKQLKPPNEGYFNISSFLQIFSNSIFAYNFHHSFPNIAAKLPTTKDVDFVCKIGFMISGLTLIIIPLTGSMAFGKELGTGDKLIYYNFDFQHKLNLVYWITSSYVFLNMAAFSVCIIVIRTYLLRVISPQTNPQKLSKKTLVCSFLILLFVLLVSWLLQNEIQIVLDFTGGIFGSIILFVIPSLEAWKSRKKANQQQNVWGSSPMTVLMLGIVFMGFNLWRLIQKL